MGKSRSGIERGLRFLLATQLEDGTWHVRRRAFPFSRRMNSGSRTTRFLDLRRATSWAVLP